MEQRQRGQATHILGQRERGTSQTVANIGLAIELDERFLGN
jgi:hypothetical protein